MSEFSREQFDAVLNAFKCQDAGQVLRAKGILSVAGQRIHFEYTPFYEECPADERKHLSEKAVVIGCDLDEEKVRQLFWVINPCK